MELIATRLVVESLVIVIIVAKMDIAERRASQDGKIWLRLMA